MQGCIKTATQSRYARMHKDSHTEPLHDATAQMAVIAQMQRHKWLSMHRCSDPNDRNSTPRYTSANTNRHSPAFLVLGGELALCGSCMDARWRSHKVVMQGCIKTATQSRCTMQRHKWLSMHRCSDPNDRKGTDAL